MNNKEQPKFYEMVEPICIEKAQNNYKKISDIIKKREKCHIYNMKITISYFNNRSTHYI
jgi:hypothetical protein